MYDKTPLIEPAEQETFARDQETFTKNSICLTITMH
jgi:hypothetical protein